MDFDASIKIKRARPKTRWSFLQIRAAVVRVSPEKVPALLEQTAVVKALREVAMHLMHRETPYQESHCFPLADAILARASAMASSKATE